VPGRGETVASGQVVGDAVWVVATEQGVQHVRAGAVELPVPAGALVEQHEAVVGVGGGDVRA